MMLGNVLDTQNMVVGRQEKFLRRLEVGFLSLKVVFRYHGDPEIWFRKVKNFRNQISGSPWERKNALRE